MQTEAGSEGADAIRYLMLMLKGRQRAAWPRLLGFVCFDVLEGASARIPVLSPVLSFSVAVSALVPSSSPVFAVTGRNLQ
jgi:hypothetical protein